MKNATYARKLNQFNTIGLTIPKEVVEEMGITTESLFKISVEDNTIKYTKLVI
ncbi:AbrB/MazE/SpoVT family DNA-binding domain-containing protein [Methanosarcina horonobensis]|uniref:AbrB/MazE/SpoVT family DNA-binding domain-containing protein n=1 Tax=Methanosarcina horonobensis TaxID=418008 RepID=UPI000A5196B7|nr:hypothetical protein [Methanosarcina horonobensis]